jgi:hypothetical protein
VIRRLFQIARRCAQSPIAWCLVAALWAGGLVAAWGAMLDHAYQPAKTATAAPPPVSVAPAPNYRVMLFAHPLCPCTRATLHELNETITRIAPQTRVQVVFVTAGLDPKSMERSALETLARELPNVDVQFDNTGDVARTYGATVSGEVIAFNPAGDLIFQGGITPARGHQGDALGQQQLEQLVMGKSNDFCAAPVYGCRLPVK